MAVCHCGYSRYRYPTTYRRAHRWHGDCIFPMWWPDSGTSGESCLIRIGEDVSIWGRFAHQTCNDLFMFIVSSLASAGSCRLHWFQKQVYLDITIDKYSSLFLASGASAVIMSFRMTFMRYGTKLAGYSPFPATHDGSGQWATVLDHREDLYEPELGLVIGWSQRVWTLFWLGASARTILPSSIL